MGKYAADFKWPDGAAIAVVFNVSWEMWDPKTLGTAQNTQRAGETVPASAKYGRNMMYVYQHAYADTGGMQRLLDMWERHGIRTSVYADGLNVQLFPSLAKQAVEQGHELLVQGWDHSFLFDLSVEEQARSIDKTIDIFKSVLGKTPAGYTTAGGTLTPESVPLAVERGFKYIAAYRNADVPFIVNHKGRKIVAQNSYALTDYLAYGQQDVTPRDVMTMWRDFFDALYDEGLRGHPKMLAFGTHPFLAMGYRTRPIEEVIQYVKAKPRVWIATREEIADYMLKNYPHLDLAAFYPEAVASDRWYGLSTGVGGQEAVDAALYHRKK
jgi:peptidoglycan/xylan/chitin deacetylase (PgdA/CDA1 family)